MARKLIKGYITPADANGYVRHVAVGAIIKTSQPVPRESTHFDAPSWKWEVITTMPEGVEYIGQYPATM